LVGITAKMRRTCWGTNAKRILNCTLEWSSPCPLCTISSPCLLRCVMHRMKPKMLRTCCWGDKCKIHLPMI
jgi:hypothetical protein